MSIPSTIPRQPTPPPPPPMPELPSGYLENPPPLPVWEESRPSAELASRQVEVIQERSSSSSSSSSEDQIEPPPAETPRETPPSIFEVANNPDAVRAGAADQENPLDGLDGRPNFDSVTQTLKSRRMKQICFKTCLIASALIVVLGTIAAGVCLIVIEKDNRKLRNLGISMVIITSVMACSGVKACLK